jgi:hypothetical protein
MAAARASRAARSGPTSSSRDGRDPPVSVRRRTVATTTSSCEGGSGEAGRGTRSRNGDSRSSRCSSPLRALTTRSSALRGLVVRTWPGAGVISTRCQKRRGRPGERASQAGSSKRPRARAKVGYGLPWTAAHSAGTRVSSSTEAHSSRTSRSNVDRPRKAARRTRLGGGDMAAAASSMAARAASTSASVTRWKGGRATAAGPVWPGVGPRERGESGPGGSSGPMGWVGGTRPDRRHQERGTTNSPVTLTTAGTTTAGVVSAPVADGSVGGTTSGSAGTARSRRRRSQVRARPR